MDLARTPLIWRATIDEIRLVVYRGGMPTVVDESVEVCVKKPDGDTTEETAIRQVQAADLA